MLASNHRCVCSCLKLYTFKFVHTYAFLWISQFDHAQISRFFVNPPIWSCSNLMLKSAHAKLFMLKSARAWVCYQYGETSCFVFAVACDCSCHSTLWDGCTLKHWCWTSSVSCCCMLMIKFVCERLASKHGLPNGTLAHGGAGWDKITSHAHLQSLAD